MIQHCTIIKNSNSSWYLISFLLLISISANAQFRNDRDRGIVTGVVERFGEQCGLRAASDADMVKRIELEFSTLRRIRFIEAQRCYENFISQIIGVLYLYQKLCSDIGSNSSEVSDTTLARQLLGVNKYQYGIRPYHLSLNDCLGSLPDKKGKPFTIPVSGSELDMRYLRHELESVDLKEAFSATIEPFR